MTGDSVATPISRLSADEGRDRFGILYCRGLGLDAGAVPTCVHPDARFCAAGNDIAAGSLDFVVAHRGLQRSADAIQTLIGWISLLRNDGILYLSVPNRRTTRDNLRLPTPPSHFLLDYAFRTRDGDYENREHIAAHLWSWSDAGELEGKTKEEAAGLAYAAVHSEHSEVNRHVFNSDTLRFVVETAASIAGRGGEALLARDDCSGDHLLVFRVSGERDIDSVALRRLVELRTELRRSIDTVVLEGLEGCLVNAISAPHRGKLLVVENRSLRWIRSPLLLDHLGLAQRDPVLFEPEEGLATAFGEDLHYARSFPLVSRLRGLENKPGVEMSPGAAPMLDKGRFDVEYLDKVDHMGPSGTYLDGAPVQVDIVLGDRLIDEVLEHGRYYYLVSSHVIEHVPDFIQFFKSAARVLVDGGKLLMWVPDKRYTFDLLRTETEIRDIISAHEMKLRNPSRAMVHDFYTYVDFSTSTDAAWRGDHVPKPTYDPAEAARIALAADLSTVDVHCFAFTPGNMRRLLAYVAEFHMPAMRVLCVTETQPGTNEFMVEIEFSDADPKHINEHQTSQPKQE